MAEDRWYSRALPILEAVSRRELEPNISIHELAREADLEPLPVSVEVERLIESRHLVVKDLARPLSSDRATGRLLLPHLGERGARAVGAWPAEDPYDNLLAVLERRISEEPDEERKSKLRRFRDTVQEVGKSVASDVLAALIKAGTGLG